MFIQFVSAAVLLAGFVSANPTLAKRDNCACGFKDSNGNVWVSSGPPSHDLFYDSEHNLQRESIISDFTAAAGALAAVNQDFGIQTWGAQHDSIYMQNSAANVFQYQG